MSEAYAPNAAPAVRPRHVAIVMDGNHRWAKERHLPGAMGHRAGAKNVKTIAEACADAGVEYLTLFAFSTENWDRPQREIELLFDLMRGMLRDDVEELNEKGVHLSIVGDRSAFPADLKLLMNRAEQMTKNNARLHLLIAVNFGGRWDIVQAAKQLAEAVLAGEIDVAGINETTFEGFLSLGSVPAPDLCIRTGGERRLSNFLLWDFAYTEFYFTDSFWPGFDIGELNRAFADYARRERRFGARKSR